MFDPRSSTRSTVVFLTALALGGLTACSQPDAEQSATGPDAAASVGADVAAQAQEIGAAIRAQERHSASLMSRKGVTGTAVGIDSEGRASVRVYLLHGDAAKGIPDHLDGIPVSTVVTGMFVARQADETSRQRPAPIGFSVGHPDITAGTIGARVLDGSGNYFILSNNHVLANSNDANPGDAALQPGPYDGGSNPADKLGTLTDFVTIAFNGSTNYVDAAIASVNPDSADYKTPSDEGYGTPNSTLFDIDGDGDPSTITDVSSNLVGLGVQKYGRTTGHTTGEVSEVNVSVNVCYECAGPFCFSCSKLAYFEDQIAVTPGDFSDGGDSGSLIVTNDGNANPVGLLFAGSSSRTLANRVDRAVNAFGVSIDDGSGDSGGDTDSPPSVGITDPVDGATVSGDVAVAADATDDGSVSHVEFFVDDGSIGTDSDGTDGWSTTWTTTSYSDGGHTVTAEATDDVGQTASDQIFVTVDNVDDGGDTAPTIDGFDVSGRVTGPWNRAQIAWSVSDADGDLASVTSELLDADGNVLDSTTSSVSGSGASGEHELRSRSTPTDVRLTVTDGAGNSTSDIQNLNF